MNDNGYRLQTASQDYARIEQAIRYLQQREVFGKILEICSKIKLFVVGGREKLELQRHGAILAQHEWQVHNLF